MPAAGRTPKGQQPPPPPTLGTLLRLLKGCAKHIVIEHVGLSCLLDGLASMQSLHDCPQRSDHHQYHLPPPRCPQVIERVGLSRLLDELDSLQLPHGIRARAPKWIMLTPEDSADPTQLQQRLRARGERAAGRG